MTPQSPYRDHGATALLYGAPSPLRPPDQHLPRSLAETCWSDHVAFDKRGRWLGSKAPRSASRLVLQSWVRIQMLWFVAAGIVLLLLASKGLLDATLALALFVGSNVIGHIVADAFGEFPPALLGPPEACVVGWSENRKRADGEAHTCPTAGPARQYVAGLNSIVTGATSWAMEEDALRRRRKELAEAVAELAGGEASKAEAAYKRLEARIACAYADFVWRESVVDPSGEAPTPFLDDDEAWDAIVETCEEIGGSWGGLALAAWWYEQRGERERSRELLHAELQKAEAHEIRERMPALWSWIELREPAWVASHTPAQKEPSLDEVPSASAHEPVPVKDGPRVTAQDARVRAPVSRCDSEEGDEEGLRTEDVAHDAKRR